MKSMKRLFTVLTLILLWGNSFGQTTASVNSNLMESHGIMSFKPMDIMATPQTLMKVWIDEPIPVDLYSDKEKEVQKLINEKTTDGIITYSPLDKEKEWTSVDYEEITPFTWKWIDFELPKPDGTLTKVNLRRPHWWLKEMGADGIGKKVYLNMPELGSQGWATVTAIRVNQLDTRFWDENRDGDYVSRPITGKFTHESNDVYNLYFGDNEKPLGVTGSHPIWSVDRNDWVGATDLKIGEKVKTQDKEVTLVSKEKVEGRHTVYNLEVYKDHNFLVSANKILVHNSCWGGDFFYKGIGRQKAIDHIWDGHSFAKRRSGKSYFSSKFSTKGKIKDLVSNARAKAKANHNAGTLRDDGKRVFQVEMDDYVGFNRQGRKTKTMTIIEDGGRFNNAFPGTL